MQVDLGLVNEFEDVSLPARRVADTIGDDVDLGLLFSNAIFAAEWRVRLMIGPNEDLLIIDKCVLDGIIDIGG